MLISVVKINSLTEIFINSVQNYAKKTNFPLQNRDNIIFTPPRKHLNKHVYEYDFDLYQLILSYYSTQNIYARLIQLMLAQSRTP